MLPCITQKICLKWKQLWKVLVGSGILVTQAKVSLQKSGLAGQLLKIKDQYKCLVKLIEKMESAKYTIKEAVQAIQELDFGKDQYLNCREGGGGRVPPSRVSVPPSRFSVPPSRFRRPPIEIWALDDQTKKSQPVRVNPTNSGRM